VDETEYDMSKPETRCYEKLRWANDFSTGYGDYTKEREEWLGELSLDDIVSEIRRMRKLCPPEVQHRHLRLKGESGFIDG